MRLSLENRPIYGPLTSPGDPPKHVWEVGDDFLEAHCHEDQFKRRQKQHRTTLIFFKKKTRHIYRDFGIIGQNSTSWRFWLASWAPLGSWGSRGSWLHAHTQGSPPWPILTGTAKIAKAWGPWEWAWSQEPQEPKDAQEVLPKSPRRGAPKYEREAEESRGEERRAEESRGEQRRAEQRRVSNCYYGARQQSAAVRGDDPRPVMTTTAWSESWSPLVYCLTNYVELCGYWPALWGLVSLLEPSALSIEHSWHDY